MLLLSKLREFCYIRLLLEKNSTIDSKIKKYILTVILNYSITKSVQITGGKL